MGGGNSRVAPAQRKAANLSDAISVNFAVDSVSGLESISAGVTTLGSFDAYHRSHVTDAI
jgi:hypothetical protein